MTSEPGSRDQTQTAAPRALRLSGAVRRWSVGLRAWVLGAVLSVVLSLSGMVLVLRLWKADWSVPLTKGDATFLMMLVRNMQVGGWPRSSPLLNVPLGQDLRGYPNSVGDAWNLSGLKLLSFVATPAEAVNTAFVVGFVLVTLGAFVALGVLGVSLRGSVALAAVYSWLPYHFLRGEGHLFLSMYAAIPLACAAAVAVYRGGEGVRLPCSRRARIWLGLATAVVLGGTGIYYAAFAIVLLSTAAVLRALHTRAWRTLAVPAIGSAVIGAVALAPGISSIAYRLQGGTSAVEGRSYGVSEFYGLKITNLLLPIGNHRVPVLGHLSAGTADSVIRGEGGTEALGLLGVAGLLIVVVAALMPAHRTTLGRALAPMGVLTVVTLVTATVAGLNGVFALAGLANLRAWNRMSVVVAFFALAGIGLVLDELWRRLTRRRPTGVLRTATALVTTAGVAVFGLLDQTSNAMVPNYPANAASWHADDEYFAQVQAELGADARVFELPVVPFPENPPVLDMPDYDHLRGYLHSDLGWSYAGLKGTDAEWQEVALSSGIELALPKLVAAGFDAVYVNRTGYEDGGATVEKALADVAGPPVTSKDGTLAVYDLRPWAATLEPAELPARDDVLYPARVRLGTGAYPLESSDTESWQWCAGVTHGKLVNPTDATITVHLTATLRVAGAATAGFTANGGTTTIDLPRSAGRLDLTLDLAPGTTDFTLTTDAAPTPSGRGDERDLRIQVADLTVMRQN